MFEFFGTQRQTELLQTKLDIGMVRCMREAVTSVCECRWARFLAATLLYVMRSVSLFLSSTSLSIKFQLRCYSQLATNKLCLSLPPLCPSSCALTSSRPFLLPFPQVWCLQVYAFSAFSDSPSPPPSPTHPPRRACPLMQLMASRRTFRRNSPSRSGTLPDNSSSAPSCNNPCEIPSSIGSRS